MAGSRLQLHLTNERARYLGESRASARHVIGTNRTAMIDECSPGQRTLRALIALYTLNFHSSRPRSGFLNHGASALPCYTMTLSPRRNDLVIVSDAPDNIGHRLQSTPLGLRFIGEAVTRQHNRVYRFVHAPTGALVTSTSSRGSLAGVQTIIDPQFPNWWVGTDETLNAEELESHAFAEALDPDARNLLAALAVRLCASDQHTWAVGQYWWDPLRRPPAPNWGRRRFINRDERRLLHGSGTRWELRWTDAPFPQDVVRALTHSVCGLAGARVEGQGTEVEISYGKARLYLRPF